MTIKFIHIRPFIEYQNKGTGKMHKIYYNQACVAYTKPENGKCIIGIARCNNKDNYAKKIGRAISTARLEREGQIVDVSPNRCIHDITKLVKEQINCAVLGAMKNEDKV